MCLPESLSHIRRFRGKNETMKNYFLVCLVAVPQSSRFVASPHHFPLRPASPARRFPFSAHSARLFITFVHENEWSERSEAKKEAECERKRRMRGEKPSERAFRVFVRASSRLCGALTSCGPRQRRIILVCNQNACISLSRAERKAATTAPHTIGATIWLSLDVKTLKRKQERKENEKGERKRKQLIDDNNSFLLSSFSRECFHLLFPIRHALFRNFLPRANARTCVTLGVHCVFLRAAFISIVSPLQSVGPSARKIFALKLPDGARTLRCTHQHTRPLAWLQLICLPSPSIEPVKKHMHKQRSTLSPRRRRREFRSPFSFSRAQFCLPAIEERTRCDVRANINTIHQNEIRKWQNNKETFPNNLQ